MEEAELRKIRPHYFCPECGEQYAGWEDRLGESKTIDVTDVSEPVPIKMIGHYVCKNGHAWTGPSVGTMTFGPATI
jgi:hypothetical protein